MNVQELNKKLGFQCVTGEKGLTNEVSGVYIGDLLSWVMGKAKAYNAWITIQGHINVVAVAILSGISCIILSDGSQPEPDMVKKAAEEEIPVLVSNKNSYELACMLHDIGF
ncbi:MAG: AraC family transcriptional regulator [Clostridiales bacterium]|nr:AraC family transcriptional regulator [Clostridiales bacterium]